ncbi:dipeptide ABC transporter ATP-binding protein [Fervidibacillus albus]|uniref:Dipeptide ABC transporter ATP-binding protein n=1 Tax=Fervidibacillus albus TaxID=2980026 RepID=A0A9E8LX58_9BACI|nr:dipeptide ABC transporter ATP-binding protein [Fervidibacillus albus]
MQETNTDTILEVNNLKKYFPIKGGVLRRTVGYVKAVDDVSLKVLRGETLGIVGESGSGKSTLGRVILRLLNPTEGQILFENEDITKHSNRKLRSIRKDLQIVFQDPYASLNPSMSVQELIEEPLVVQTNLSRKERLNKVNEILEKVGLRTSDQLKYPHEFSGGQRQRISIARALVLNPKFVVCDEPVSALDVSIQAQVLNLMADLQDELDLTYLFISHDLSVVKHISDRVAVMYLGRIAEVAPKKAIYEEPLHPYTQALLSSIPTVDKKNRREKIILKGDLPSPSNPPSGCPFRTRCSKAFDLCSEVRPELKDMGNGHYVACHLYE